MLLDKDWYGQGRQLTQTENFQATGISKILCVKSIFWKNLVDKLVGWLLLAPNLTGHDSKMTLLCGGTVLLSKNNSETQQK